MSEIKVGDKIFLKRFGKIIGVETVTRVTKTLVRSERHNYRKPADGSNFMCVTGQTGWEMLTGHLNTPGLSEEWHKLELTKWIGLNWQRISYDDIEILKRKMGDIL